MKEILTILKLSKREAIPVFQGQSWKKEIKPGCYSISFSTMPGKAHCKGRREQFCLTTQKSRLLGCVSRPITGVKEGLWMRTSKWSWQSLSWCSAGTGRVEKLLSVTQKAFWLRMPHPQEGSGLCLGQPSLCRTSSIPSLPGCQWHREHLHWFFLIGANFNLEDDMFRNHRESSELQFNSS